MPWFAIKTRAERAALPILEQQCDEVYAPRRRYRTADHSSHTVLRPVVPGLILINTEEHHALRLERDSLQGTHPGLPPIRCYRLPGSTRIQPITPREIELFKLLTVDDPSLLCEVYRKPDFRIGQHVTITDGPFAGYTGYTRRIRANKHVVVEIEGLCAIALPFLHPSLLRPLRPLP